MLSSAVLRCIGFFSVVSLRGVMSEHPWIKRSSCTRRGPGRSRSLGHTHASCFTLQLESHVGILLYCAGTDGKGEKGLVTLT